MGIFISLGDAMETVGGSSELNEHLKGSPMFKNSFCRHNYKLISSKIFSSGKFQQEHVQQAREAATSRASSVGSLRSLGSSSNLLKRRSESHGSMLSCENDPWGWFEDVEEAHPEDALESDAFSTNLDGVPIVKQTPPYILTESLSAQKLWHQTAGHRPPQPQKEREHFEQLWLSNFNNSLVDYEQRPTPTEASRKRQRTGSSNILYRATSPFGSAVSKSFKCDNCGEISSIMVHIPKFQIVQTGSDVHAEYLIVVGLGHLTLGVWRRFREFKRLATKISSSGRRKQFHNALCSWRCLQNRQRWFRCLDKDYLILKCFLLERFLHDLVFESMSPDTVREFLGVL